jgi:hypothetical protein
MILILRGHIRSAFDNNELINLIKAIYKFEKDLKIYIHTWNIFSSNLSWRPINQNNTIVTPQIIFEYFNELSHLIKIIIIDDDNEIKLHGKTDGVVCNTLMPLKGWKNYWYGKYKLIYNIYNVFNICNMYNTYHMFDPKPNIIAKNEMIINMRFDILNNSNSFNDNIIINFIKNNSKKIFKRNQFLDKDEFTGCDNIYLGNIYTMFKLARIFFYNLDIIMKNNMELKYQEFLVMRINDKI